MTGRSTIGFVLGALSAAALGAALLFAGYGWTDRAVAGWSAAGFVAMAVPGILGGAWLAREHGRSASRFLVALATGFLTRLIAAAVSAYLASRAGGAASIALLAGLAAGFVPVMLFEIGWFIRARGAHALGSEPSV